MEKDFQEELEEIMQPIDEDDMTEEVYHEQSFRGRKSSNTKI